MKPIIRSALCICLAGFLNASCANGQAIETAAGDQSIACTEFVGSQNLSSDLTRWFAEKGELHAFDSLIVEQCSERLFSASFAGFELDEIHEIQSATKTLSAIAIGAAIQNGLIESIDQPLSTLLPDYAPLLVGKKGEITLRHVLSMRTGLFWQDFGLGNSFRRVEGAEDSAFFVLSQPLVSDPDEAFFYNTGSSHLLSAIVEAVSGMSAQEYLQSEVLDEIGVTTLEWRMTRDGLSKGGWDAFLSPNDMVKIGELLLANGKSPEGEQLVPQSFVQGMLSEHSAKAFGEHGYGFQAWVVNGYGTKTTGARGYGQQNIFVLPQVNAVVVTTANIFYPNENGQMVDELMIGTIVPALKSNQ